MKLASHPAASPSRAPARARDGAAWPFAARAEISAALAVELLRAGHDVRVRARGRSMWPRVVGGSLLELSPERGERLVPGELGAFERSGRLVIHRVLALTAHGVRFGGDALAQDDGVVPFGRVLGRARVVTRRRLTRRLPHPHELVLGLHALRRWLACLVRARLQGAALRAQRNENVPLAPGSCEERK